MSDESKPDPFQNKYEAFYSMGNALYKSKQYRRAVWYLTQAIENDKSKSRPLIERSSSYLQLSKYDKALEDIENAGKIDKKNPKILLLHGEIFYQKGEFEKALMIFQRGKRRRGTMYDFQLGINKCELCIKNAANTDNPKKIELNDSMDLTEYYEEAYPDIKEQRLAKIRQKEQAMKKKRIKVEGPKVEDDELPNKMPIIPFNKKTMRILLESEAQDRRFINDICEIEDDRIILINSAKSVPEGIRKQKEGFSKSIQKSTIESAVYMDNRTNFWYRQNPKKVTDINNVSNNSAYFCDELPPISKNYNMLVTKCI